MTKVYTINPNLGGSVTVHAGPTTDGPVIGAFTRRADADLFVAAALGAEDFLRRLQRMAWDECGPDAPGGDRRWEFTEITIRAMAKQEAARYGFDLRSLPEAPDLGLAVTRVNEILSRADDGEVEDPLAEIRAAMRALGV